MDSERVAVSASRRERATENCVAGVVWEQD